MDPVRRRKATTIRAHNFACCDSHNANSRLDTRVVSDAAVVSGSAPGPTARTAITTPVASTLPKRGLAFLARVVRDGFNTLWEDSTPEPAEGIGELLRVGESQTVEFKSTARWNLHTGRPDKKMEHVITKTVCGFLNGQGGKLLIGVDDDGDIVGLGPDLQTLRKGNKDGYKLFLRQLLDDSLSVPTAGIVHISFEAVADEDVCVLSASSSGKPVFTKPHEGGTGHSEFWVRIGNATKQLHGDDMLEYQTYHWGT